MDEPKLMNEAAGDNGEDQATTPMDEAISKVESYVADPKTVTPETLTELLDLLKEIKADVESDDESEDAGEDSIDDKSNDGTPSVMIALGVKKKKQGGGY